MFEIMDAMPGIITIIIKYVIIWFLLKEFIYYVRETENIKFIDYIKFIFRKR